MLIIKFHLRIRHKKEADGTVSILDSVVTLPLGQERSCVGPHPSPVADVNKWLMDSFIWEIHTEAKFFESPSRVPHHKQVYLILAFLNSSRLKLSVKNEDLAKWAVVVGFLLGFLSPWSIHLGPFLPDEVLIDYRLVT